MKWDRAHRTARARGVEPVPSLADPRRLPARAELTGQTCPGCKLDRASFRSRKAFTDHLAVCKGGDDAAVLSM